MALNYWHGMQTVIKSFQIHGIIYGDVCPQQHHWRSDSPPVCHRVPEKSLIKGEWQTRRNSINGFCGVCQSTPCCMSARTQEKCKHTRKGNIQPHLHHQWAQTQHKNLNKLSRMYSKTSNPPPTLTSLFFFPRTDLNTNTHEHPGTSPSPLY